MSLMVHFWSSGIITHILSDTTSSWSMHNCVHSWTLATLNKDIDTYFYLYVFDCVNATIGETNDPSFNHSTPSCTVGYVARLVQWRFLENNLISGFTSNGLKGAARISLFLQNRLEFTATEQIYVGALASLENALGPDHTTTFTYLNNLAIL